MRAMKYSELELKASKTRNALLIVTDVRTVILRPSLGKEEVMSKDPVCGMNVDEKKATAQKDYKGRPYYFCSMGCKQAFEKEPAKYVKS